MAAHTPTPDEIAAVVAAVEKIPAELFDRYEGSRENEITTALTDAVFSIRAMYDSATPGLGVSGRLSTFRDEHPETLDDLHALIEVGAQEIARIMGDGKTTQRSKASAVIEAADALVTAGVVTSADLRQKATSGQEEYRTVKAAYTGVHGLGKVTFEYLMMLVGVPGVKSDVMICRFVAHALGEQEVSCERAHALVVGAHAELRQRAGFTQNLTAFDHAIWLHQRAMG